MFSCRFSLFCLVAILCVCLCVGSSHMKKCMETERQALLKLKDSFIDGSRILSSWTGEDCCKWTGISCNNLSGHVTRLDLHCTNYDFALRGRINSSICELQHLTFLDLSHNYLEREIPKCIGSLGELIELRLGGNYLDSYIPPTLANLSNLQTLELRWNPLIVANDLEWVSHLSNLRYLDLSYVNLSRAVDWISSIRKLHSLLEVNLTYCGLPQPNLNSIPHINSSTSLQSPRLSGNYLISSNLPWVLNISKALTYLDLSDNELEGRISTCFQGFCRLQTLLLSSNKLSGQLKEYIQQLYCAQNSIEELDFSSIPFNSEPFPNFSMFSSLRTLRLRNSNIVGPLPHSFGHLPNLTSLDLGQNQLTGPLSLLNFTKLVSLEDLDLSYNQLNGTLPFAIGQLSALESLHVSSNKLSGVISEAHLSKLSNLRILDVSENSFSFNMSSNWVPPFQLNELHASSCILGPNFPSWLKHQRNLTVLDISNSGISGSFPRWLWNPTLNYLNVSHNKLSGPLPKSLSNLQTGNFYYGIWDLSFNNLVGPLPHFPKYLVGLVLSNNKFSGSISSLCGKTLLHHLDLSSNLLEGQLSNCWEQFQELQVLNLANNNFSGRIPNSFGMLQQIETIHLNNNNFSGAIPNMTLCHYLKLIDFGNNNLEGTIPAWVGHNLHRPIVLRLRANKFQGSLPSSLCNLLSLQVLDVSENNIIGEIPQCLGDITALSNTMYPRLIPSSWPFFLDIFGVYLPIITSVNEQMVLTWKGADREYGKNIGLMKFIDLSCNHLTGEIPQSITTLMALAGLNLSGNNLTGFIPDNIGHMKMLESLDLSRNHLNGRIPASLSNLTFLGSMNLSFNNLSGKIPESTQLDTFDASAYVGNNGLCGPTIKKPCPGDESSPNPQLAGSIGKDGAVDDELVTFGFYVTLGLGFIVGFWAVCGTLFFKSSWRHAYFQFFDNINDWLYVQLVVYVARIKRRFQVQD